MRIVSIVAARPNFIKLAAVHHALAPYPSLEHVIIHTGQHYDPLFSDVFFSELRLPSPNHNLGVKGGDNQKNIDRTDEALRPVLQDIQPDCVLVYGDVSGALGAAQAAHALELPLAHVEAGLRSFDSTMPEESNRIAIDHLAAHLFVSEEAGLQNLEREHVTDGVHFVGNTMIDTLVRMLPYIEAQELPQDTPDRFGIVTLHRPGNVDQPEKLRLVLSFLSELAKDIPLIFPMHRRTSAAIERYGLGGELSDRIRVVDPLGYLAFLRLVLASTFILTDSGGIQEETTYLGKKCFTLRPNTERPSTIASGSNELIDTERIADRERVLAFARNPLCHLITIPPLWDGKAGGRIVGILQQIINT